MSKIRKRPWSHPSMGSTHAKNIRMARMIKDQDQLDLVLAAAGSPQIAEKWLEIFGEHLPFTPRPFEVVQPRQGE